MTLLKTIIVDDEPEAREGLKLLLSQDPEVQVIKLCHNGLEAIEEISRNNPALVFIDIQMPQISGFDVLRSLDTLPPAVIFTTAYDQYAIDAFEFHALDYLLKPYSDDRFFKALKRAKEHAMRLEMLDAQTEISTILEKMNVGNSEEGSLVAQQKSLAGRLVIKTSGKVHFIRTENILYFEAYDYYVKIHTDEKMYLVRTSLKDLQSQLSSQGFIRIHKSYIVNTSKIVEMESHFRGDGLLSLEGGISLKVSRTYRKNIDQFLLS